MKQKFAKLRATLDEFAQQDEYPMLVVGCGSDDLLYVLKLFEALEQTLPGHLVAGFHQPFHDPKQWLDAMVDSLQIQLEARASQREHAGDPSAARLPLTLLDSRCPAPQRLAAFLAHIASLLPNQTEYRALVGLLPLECHDLEAFAELIATAIPVGGQAGPELPTGVTALRLLVWDDLQAAILRDALLRQQTPYVLRYADDFSTPALIDAVGHDAANTALPLADRMNALMQLAALDHSYRRPAAALDKYALLHEYHYHQGAPEMQALALLGAGDTLIGAGDPVAGKQRLQQGIAVAMSCNNLGVLSILLRSITDVSMSLGEHAEAESYAESGAKVAAAALTPNAYADMYEKRGDAQLAQEKRGEAMVTYTRCRELCRGFEYFERWYSVLDKQSRFYAEARMTAEHRALIEERAQAQALEAKFVSRVRQ